MSERHDRGARPIGVRLRVALRAAVVLAGSVAAAPTSAQAAPQVVVTIKPLHSLVAAVMDGLAVPTLLLPGAGSPHGASLKPSQARALREAELVFWIGPELEGTLVKPLRALATEARVIAATELDGVRLWSVRAGGVWLANARAPDSHDPGIAARDPHLWLDPGNAEQIVRAAVAALSAADPANAARLTRNGAATIARLRALDRELAATLAPVKNLSYLAFHDSTQYFERRYGLAAVGSIATSPEAARREAAARDPPAAERAGRRVHLQRAAVPVGAGDHRCQWHGAPDRRARSARRRPGARTGCLFRFAARPCRCRARLPGAKRLIGKRPIGRVSALSLRSDSRKTRARRGDIVVAGDAVPAGEAPRIDLAQIDVAVGGAAAQWSAKSQSTPIMPPQARLSTSLSLVCRALVPRLKRVVSALLRAQPSVPPMNGVKSLPLRHSKAALTRIEVVETLLS